MEAQQQGLSNFPGGIKRPRDLSGIFPSPGEPMFVTSPYMMDMSPRMAQQNNSPQMRGYPHQMMVNNEEFEYRLDGKAIMEDYLMLSTSGHCSYESMSRGINQKTWVMNLKQRTLYFENVARIILSQESDNDLMTIVQKFCKGSSTNVQSLGQGLSEAFLSITKNVDAISSIPQSPPIYAFTRSPWTMYTSNILSSDILRQNSLNIDDRKWLLTPSLSGGQRSAAQIDQNMDVAEIKVGEEANNNVIMDKTNARKKTVSALNRMKQFVVPNSNGGTTGSDSDSNKGSSPVMQSVSNLPGMPYNMRPSYTMSNMYQSGMPGGMSPNMTMQSVMPNMHGLQNGLSGMPNGMNMQYNSSPQITPVDNMISGMNVGRPKMSPDLTMSDIVVCRRKKPRVADTVGPKGVSKTGSTWRIQVQVRGGFIVDSSGQTIERKKYRFSRYVSDYVEALWMYEVAILLSDRPKDLAAQMENGNYAILLENKVVSGPDNYYLELGIRVSAFVHSERCRDNNTERILAVQAYDAMKPSTGFSLMELGQTIVNMGPMYASMSKMEQSR